MRSLCGGMRENGEIQRTHDVKKMAQLLEELSSDTDIGTNQINSSIVTNDVPGRTLQSNLVTRANTIYSMTPRVIRPRQNSFVKFKELDHNDLFVTKSHDSYFDERGARLKKRVSFNFEIQSDDGDTWSPTETFKGGLNDFQRADSTLKRIEKRSQVSRSFKPMQSFDESIERIASPDQKPYIVKPLKRKMSFVSFVKNIQRDKNRCAANSSLKEWKDGPITTRRNSFMNFIQNQKPSSNRPPVRPASAIKNRSLICRDFEGEDSLNSISSFTTMKKHNIKSDQNPPNRPPPLIQPKLKRNSSRTSVTLIFNNQYHDSQSLNSSYQGSSWRSSSSFSRSDSGYTSNQSLPPPTPMTETHHHHQPSAAANQRPSISQSTATVKRRLSQIPSNPIYEDFPHPLESFKKTSNSDACDLEKSRHRAMKSPEMIDKSKRKESKSTLMTKTRRFSQNVLGHITKKPRKSQTRSTRFIGVNKYRAFENLVSC